MFEGSLKPESKQRATNALPLHSGQEAHVQMSGKRDHNIVRRRHREVNHDRAAFVRCEGLPRSSRWVARDSPQRRPPITLKHCFGAPCIGGAQDIAGDPVIVLRDEHQLSGEPSVGRRIDLTQKSTVSIERRGVSRRHHPSQVGYRIGDPGLRSGSPAAWPFQTGATSALNAATSSIRPATAAATSSPPFSGVAWPGSEPMRPSG